MADSVFSTWECGEQFAAGQTIVRGTHTLGERDLFSDEGLAALIEQSPKEHVWFYAMGNDPEKPQEWKVGRRGTRSAADVIEAVKRGRLWVNVTHVERHQDAYTKLLADMYGELAARSPGFEVRDYACNVLISSPKAMVYYHADALPNMLWHVRGKKRFYLYPHLDGRFAPQDFLERIFAAEVSEELPYKKEFEDYASVFELGPGDILAWPQNSPHRVQNTEGLNVSLSTEHRTPEGTRRELVYCANHFLRQRLGLPAQSTNTSGTLAEAKTFGFRAVRKAAKILGRTTSRHNDPPIEFEVDLEAPNCVRSLTAG